MPDDNVQQLNPFAQFWEVSPRAKKIMDSVPANRFNRREANLVLGTSHRKKKAQYRPQSTNIYTEFSKVIKEGVERTRFQKGRIEAFLPDEIKGIFQKIQTNARSLPDSEKSRALIKFIQDEIFAKLPDYTSPAKLEENEGFFIQGKLVSVFMPAAEANPQILNAIIGLNVKKFKTRALRDFCGGSRNFMPGIMAESKFEKIEIYRAIGATTAFNRNRQLIAKLLCLAEEMKSAPTPE